MGLKKRLAVAFMIMLLVPTVLLGITGAIIVNVQEKTIERGHYLYDDGSMVFYMIRNEQVDAPKLKVTLFQLAFLSVIVIMITAICLVVWLYRSILRPLNKISAATRSVQEGKLDFSIQGDSDDELGQLCEDFEEMRRHLKEETDARLKYENDMVELISNISHDLKTPLTAIKGYAEGIIDGVADTEQKREKYLKTIYSKASDMQVLVDELSFYSKIDSDIVPYNFDRIDIAAYFEDCAEELSLDTEVKGITLEYRNMLPGQALVMADAEQLRRVVNNLIGNSVKYMDKEEGHISITTVDSDRFVKVSVADNGAGIDENDIPHVFDRFYRADASRNSKKGGSGLGLAIAKKIIEDHGGTIEATSTKGEGTTISFTLQKACDGLFCDEVEDAEYVKLKGKLSLWRDKGKEKKNGKDIDHRG